MNFSPENWLRSPYNSPALDLKIKKRLTAQTAYNTQLERKRLPNLGIFNKPKPEEE
jgi:hypothetical protein